MKFTKEIVGPGKYRATKPGTNERVETVITPQRIEHWVNTFTKMKEAGLKIPAPFKHRMDMLALTNEQADLLTKQEQAGSINNGGYWDDLFVDTKTGKLCGVLDAPNKETAAKIGTDVQECSLLSLPTYEDGLGRKWDDGILHIALVTNPIVPGQENFQPLTDSPVTAIAMSQFVEAFDPTTSEPTPDLATPASAIVDSSPSGEALALPVPSSETGVTEALSVLKEFGIELPVDTTTETLSDRIVMVGRAVLSAKNESSDNELNQDYRIKTGGIQMSQTVTADSPQGKFAMKQQVNKITDRLTAIVKSGRVSADYIKEVIHPHMAGCQMSLEIDDEGNLGPTSLDITLDALERLPVNAALTGADPVNLGEAYSITEPHKQSKGAEITEADAEKVVATLFKNLGFPVAG